MAHLTLQLLIEEKSHFKIKVYNNTNTSNNALSFTKKNGIINVNRIILKT